eukprot:359919-Chlamydomonas_euryale.AAC.3
MRACIAAARAAVGERGLNAPHIKRVAFSLRKQVDAVAHEVGHVLQRKRAVIGPLRRGVMAFGFSPQEALQYTRHGLELYTKQQEEGAVVQRWHQAR